MKADSTESVSIHLVPDEELESIESRCKSKNYTYTPLVGCHKIYTSPENWKDAQKSCQQDGTDLAIVNSKAEEKVSFIRLKLLERAAENRLPEDFTSKFLKYFSPLGVS